MNQSFSKIIQFEQNISSIHNQTEFVIDRLQLNFNSKYTFMHISIIQSHYLQI